MCVWPVSRPSLQPAGNCGSQKEGMCLTELPEILYLPPLSGSSFSHPAQNVTSPAQQATGTQGRLLV